MNLVVGSGQKTASIVWLEPGHVHAGSHDHALAELSGGEVLARTLAALPAGPTHWVVDDALVPTLLLRDIAELPPGTEAREAFFRWRFARDLLLDAPQFVQALAMGEATWLVAGLDQGLREAWVQAAAAAGRPMRQLLPRWLWIYNRLAPSREVPGLLLALSPRPGGTWTGTLAAWSRNLTLLRQWSDPASAETWNQERVLPTIAYLQRDARSPLDLHLWGTTQWPDCGIPVRILPKDLPEREAL